MSCAPSFMAHHKDITDSWRHQLPSSSVSHTPISCSNRSGVILWGEARWSKCFIRSRLSTFCKQLPLNRREAYKRIESARSLQTTSMLSHGDSSRETSKVHVSPKIFQHSWKTRSYGKYKNSNLIVLDCQQQALTRRDTCQHDGSENWEWKAKKKKTNRLCIAEHGSSWCIVNMAAWL